MLCVPIFSGKEGETANPRLSQAFEDWSGEFMERIFVVLTHQHVATDKGAGDTSGDDSDGINPELFWETFKIFFSQISDDLYKKCLGKLFNFLSGAVISPVKNVASFLPFPSQSLSISPSEMNVLTVFRINYSLDTCAPPPR